ncbi:MAG: hypothetical protein AAF203_00100 [Pseudomonadota bacterium]
MELESLKKDMENQGAAADLVNNVKFSLKEKRRRKHTGERDLLFVSLHGLTDDQKDKVLRSFDKHRHNWISFPIKERSKHLMVRFRNNIYNFGYWPIPWFSQFRVWPSRLPQRATIETVTYLENQEKDRLKNYIENIRRHKRKTIGKFHNDGYQKTNNTLVNNRTEKRGHNCTSWIATAPISEESKSFMEELGADRSFNIGTNPGWWSAWLLSQSERSTFAIYWDTQPLEKMKKRIGEEGYFEWDFRRM